jgi:LDH2 family malate/lactate/ureidoglycolate dehydrogenase
MAEHKGYAIAMMMDVLSGVLTGSAFGSAVNGPYQFDKRSGCGHLMIVMNIDAFQPLSVFNERMELLIQATKAVPLAEGFEEVFYPGELEAINETKNRKEGIQLPDDTIADLRKMANTVGLESQLPF